MSYLIQYRQQKILEFLAGKEHVSVSELSKILEVSEVTVRTDLNSLVKLGKIGRLHGGAYLIEERLKQEYTFQTRKSLNLSEKQKIGAVASTFVNSSDCILLDSSSTVLALAHIIKKKNELKDITVIPTGIWTAIELMGCSNINVLLPGGYLRHTTGSITGLPTSNFLSDLLIQKAFLGAWGISYGEGLTDTHLLEIELKKFIISRSREVIVLVDGSKFRQIGLSSYANINQISKIITDASAPMEEIEKFRNAGVEVLIAN
ncbi:MAG: DeoR/GlpR family DNA-binding transcription regulator [Ignavibacteriaceae bacterium]|jgi:DeoR/GlpR family transcriptional regulator of sugar metabolism